MPRFNKVRYKGLIWAKFGLSVTLQRGAFGRGTPYVVSVNSVPSKAGSWARETMKRRAKRQRKSFISGNGKGKFIPGILIIKDFEKDLGYGSLWKMISN